MSKVAGPRLIDKNNIPKIKRKPMGRVPSLPEVQATVKALEAREHLSGGKSKVLAIELSEQTYQELIDEGLKRPLWLVKQVLLYHMKTNKIPHGRVKTIGDKAEYKVHMVTVEAPN
jgi:hypothetical protein